MFALPLSWLLYAPFGGWATLGRMLQERARLLINSPADLVYRLLQERFGWDEPAAWRATTQAATIAFFVIAAVILAWFWWVDRRMTMRRACLACAGPGEPPDALLWRVSTATTVAYLLIGSFWFQHWYLLWVLAPAVLLPTSRWTQTLLPAYCLGALWSNLTNSFARTLPAYSFSATQVSAINLLAQVAPLLCVLLATRFWLDASRLLAAARAAAQEKDHYDSPRSPNHDCC
jgi:hypothetical protein